MNEYFSVATFLLVTGISILVGGLIVSHYSFTTLFIIMGVVQTIGAIYQGKILYLKK
ncbi:hypothetical protein HY970_00985 [Candidatus Kaiserbacteria bacterium]|nr:hypothetical protein [Candidatus Kaiserbacteria bacterium]